MLTQEKADALMAMVKTLVDQATIEFPLAGQARQFAAVSEDGHEAFVFDVNRKGKIKVSKCTYQERYAVVEVSFGSTLTDHRTTIPTGPRCHVRICMSSKRASVINGPIPCQLGFSPIPQIW